MNPLINFFKSFKYALDGIIHTISSQKNMKIHAFSTRAVIALGLYFNLTPIEWISCSIAISLVLSTECINTAIECSIDLFTTDHHPLAKNAKDTAAGAVLITSITALIIGGIIFIPKFKGVLFGS